MSKGAQYTVESRIGQKQDGSWEYVVTLVDQQTGEIIDRWSSALETDNGVQKLSKKQALNAINEIRNDVEEGRLDQWFDTE